MLLIPRFSLWPIERPAPVETGQVNFIGVGDYTWEIPFGVTSISCAAFGAGGAGGFDYHGNGGGGGGGGALIYATLAVLEGDTVDVKITGTYTELKVGNTRRLLAYAGSAGGGGNSDRAGTGGNGGSLYSLPNTSGLSGYRGSNGKYSSSGLTAAQGGPARSLPGTSLSPGMLWSGSPRLGAGGSGATRSLTRGSGDPGGLRIIWGEGRKFPNVLIEDM